MSDQSKIEWTDATWNPTRGCTKIAPGCAHCYAETFAERFRGVVGHPYERGFDPRIAPEQLTVPLHWKKPRRIFVDSMSDLFHEAFSAEYIANVFAVMALTPRHTYQVLTKRPERAAAKMREAFEWDVRDAITRRMLRDYGTEWVAAMNAFCESQDETTGGTFVPEWPLPNVWIGTSIANQTDADKNIPHLLQIPAAVRFLSCEPLLAPIELRRPCAPTFDIFPGVDWVIVGGESGPKARPCNVEWIRSIVAQCKAAGVPCFVKQLGAKCMAEYVWRQSRGGDWPNDTRDHVGHTMESPRWVQFRDRKGGDWNEWPADLRIREFPEARR